MAQTPKGPQSEDVCGQRRVQLQGKVVGAVTLTLQQEKLSKPTALLGHFSTTEQ